MYGPTKSATSRVAFERWLILADINPSPSLSSHTRTYQHTCSGLCCARGRTKRNFTRRRRGGFTLELLLDSFLVSWRHRSRLQCRRLTPVRNQCRVQPPLSIHTHRFHHTCKHVWNRSNRTLFCPTNPCCSRRLPAHACMHNRCSRFRGEAQRSRRGDSLKCGYPGRRHTFRACSH